MDMERLFAMIKKFADEAKPPRLAVCVCIFKGEKLLAVARRGTTDEWSLPGGKVDAGEAPLEASVREV